MKLWRRRAIVVPVTLGLVLGLSGGALAAFSATATNGVNRLVAAADWEAPHVTRTVIAKTVGYLTGKIHQGGQFYVYAQIDDGGNPGVGVGTVTADVSSISNGGTAVAMTAGAYSAGGVLYNYRSGVRNAINAIAEGTRTYAFTMSDVAVPVHTQTRTGFPVVIDNTRPSPVNWTATNKGGGIVGRAEQGDIVTYTWSEPIDPESLVAGWNGGSPTTVTARISNGGGNARFRIRNATGLTTLPFGTIYLRRNYVSASTNFPNSTITMIGNTVTVVLGAPAVPGNINTVTVATTPTWTPSTAAYDVAGNAMAAAAITLPGGPKIFF
jgi:large repetitive protein